MLPSYILAQLLVALAATTACQALSNFGGTCYRAQWDRDIPCMEWQKRNCTQVLGRCTPAGIEQEKSKAAARQHNRAVQLRKMAVQKLDGIVSYPGPRGKLGHGQRCPIASDAKINELLEDQSNKLWEKAKELVQLAARELNEEVSSGDLQVVRNLEDQCRNQRSRCAHRICEEHRG